MDLWYRAILEVKTGTIVLVDIPGAIIQIPVEAAGIRAIIRIPTEQTHAPLTINPVFSTNNSKNKALRNRSATRHLYLKERRAPELRSTNPEP